MSVRHRRPSEKWPIGPRYTYGGITGWPITVESLHSIGRLRSTPSTYAYVHDAAFGYRVVATFANHARYGPGRKQTPLQAARALARRLNKENRQ